LRPSRIIDTGQIPHELPTRLGIQLEKLNAQLMASDDPPNGDGGYFQEIGLVWERQEQCQVVVRRHEGMGLDQRTAHRQVTDNSYSFNF
jgi:hypothetical protein